MTCDTTTCKHEFAPGNMAQGLEPWEGCAVYEARCTKCGHVDPENQFMPPEVWARREQRRLLSPAEFDAWLRREIAPDSIGLAVSHITT